MSASQAGGEIVEVQALKGIRMLTQEDDTPRVEYLVAWKDGSPDTWCASEPGAMASPPLATIRLPFPFPFPGSPPATWPTTSCVTTSSSGGVQ